MLDPATVDNIAGPQVPPYDAKTSDGIETNFDFAQLPEGYMRPPPPVADERYITDMGEHAAPTDAPELPNGPDEQGDPTNFDNTLIQGFIGDKEGSQLAFVEPMLTREFLSGFEGTETYDIPQRMNIHMTSSTHTSTASETFHRRTKSQLLSRA